MTGQVIFTLALAVIALAIGFAWGRSTSGRRTAAPEQFTPPLSEDSQFAKEPTSYERLTTLLFEGFRKACEPIASTLNFGELKDDSNAREGRETILKFKEAEPGFRSRGGDGNGQLVAAAAVEMTHCHMTKLAEVLRKIARQREGQANQFEILCYLSQLSQLSDRLNEIMFLSEARQIVDDGIGRTQLQSSVDVSAQVGTLVSVPAEA